jgi:hypothetical protein
VSKEETNAIIANVEKAKVECLTAAQKNLEDNKLHNAMHDLCAARLFIEVAIKKTRVLWEKQTG